MFDWEGRILDNKSILAVKAALPYLDIPVGEIIDLEGLLRAIRCFCQKREQKIIDMILNFFMFKRVMSMMNMMNEAQNSNQGMEGMFELLKNQMPKEQQEMFDMMSMMMSAMELNPGGAQEAAPDERPEEPEMFHDAAGPEPAFAAEETGEPQMPEVWQRIAEMNSEEIQNGGSE